MTLCMWYTLFTVGKSNNEINRMTIGSSDMHDLPLNMVEDGTYYTM